MSRFFEFYFNPKISKKQNSALETFCFTPEKRQETPLGSLYLLGELKDISPKTQNLISALADIIQKEYYSIGQSPAEISPERNFERALGAANEFLAKETRQENTDWLGKLNFSALSLAPDFSVYFSKFGDIKALLFKNKEVFGIKENDDSPIRAFSDVVEGSLDKGDRIIIFTQDIFDFFNEKGIFPRLARNRKSKEFKKIFKEQRKRLKKVSGACLLVFAKKARKKLFLKAKTPKVKKKLPLPKFLKLPKPKLPKLPRPKLPKLPKPKLPALPTLTKLPKASLKLPKFAIAKISKMPGISVISIAAANLPQRIFPQSPVLQTKMKKSLVSLLVLAALLLLGYFIF